MLSFFGMALLLRRGNSLLASVLFALRLQAQSLPQILEETAVLNDVAQPRFERHVPPRDRALHEVRDRAVRLGAPEVVGDLRQPAQGVLAGADRASRPRRRAALAGGAL